MVAGDSIATIDIAAGALDWRAPWFAPYRANIEQASHGLSDGESVAAAIDRIGQNANGGTGVRFTASSALPHGHPYESFIARTGTVPTRDNLHDLFNGLVWLAFPQTKRLLNRWQSAEIDRAGVAGTRGPLRDALTVLDENGAFLHAPDALWDALAARDWQRLFIDLRPAWREARLVLFGHALLEKLTAPRKPIAAHVLRFEPAGSTSSELDRGMVQRLSRQELARKPFLPLPVLGVPGWWAQNESPAFYDDAAVFRPRAQPPGGAANALNRVAAPPFAAFGSAHHF
ncbi:MAG: DUF3025 domain-containing protein [Burkholderiales bacterium]